MTSIFHLLMGCPASGKSTLASYLHQAIIPHSQIISTDKIREELFGDAAKQEDWALIQAVISERIQQAIADERQIIYDATNAQKLWRMDLFKQLKEFDNLNIIGWHLQTPLKICYERNSQRERQVPQKVIQTYYQALKKFPPSKDEGFTEIYQVFYDDLARDFCINL
jgi:predicted kinase